MNRIRFILMICFIFCVQYMVNAQKMTPTISFYSIDNKEDVTMTSGESQTTQAPVELNCNVDVDPNGYDYVCKWQFFSTKGEEQLLLTRYETSTTYTLSQSGGYKIVCNVTFFLDGDTIDTNEEFVITISESSLKCPNAFSPNGDGINDKFLITCKSIVKLDAVFFNRWGKKLYTMTLDNLEEGWDGMVNGKYIPDGVYFLQLNAVGSDGIKYNIKKTINVLKGFNESTDSGGAGA